MLVTELEMVMLVREEQPKKAVVPIEVTELGIETLVSNVHSLKALFPMLVTQYGFPLYVTVSGMIKSPAQES